MEFLALIPAVALLVLVLLQAVLLAGAWFSASGAARAGLRADEVGAPVDEAVRAALPDGLERGLRITRRDDAFTVTVRSPGVVPGIGRIVVAAAAHR